MISGIEFVNFFTLLYYCFQFIPFLRSKRMLSRHLYFNLFLVLRLYILCYITGAIFILNYQRLILSPMRVGYIILFNVDLFVWLQNVIKRIFC